MLILPSHLKLKKITTTVHDKCLIKMKRVLKLWVEDMNGKHVAIDGNVVFQKTLSLSRDFSKGFPETSDGQAIHCK